MPTYNYECSACGHAFEVFHSMTAPVKRKCPSCGKQKLERLIGTGAGVIFKGSGFYQTDYRSSSYEAGAKADTAASTPAAGEGGCGSPVCGTSGCQAAADKAATGAGTTKKKSSRKSTGKA
ncbi:MAG: zinc ribbon domain-containing protein [Planctomycetes bacterium]|nr:zinc ribbon domain-containing protein [Planctomycetota bacterium]